MKHRFAALPLLGLCWLLPRCALTDHYQLASDAAGMSNGAAGAGAAGNVALSGTAGTDPGASGASANAGGSAVGGSAVGGSAGIAEIGGAGTGTGGCAAKCTAAQTCCSAACVDTATDPKNCGACGTQCSEGRACAGGTCSAGWVSMSAPPSGFVSRTKAAACAMGSSVFIWGGSDANNMALDTGAIYSATTDTWVPVLKSAGMPTPRTFATCVWTGSVVIVFGGTDNKMTQAALSSGAIYDPRDMSWTPLPNAPSARSQPVGYWDGTRALFWGGTNGLQSAAIAGAERFNLTSWASASGGGDPGAVVFPAYAFDGSVLYLQGGLIGNTRQDRVSSYTGSADKWATLSKSLTARWGAFGVWDGSRFLVWGGSDSAMLHKDGAYMTGSTWTTMNTTGAPSARMLWARRSGWAFQVKPGVSAFLGGQISAQNAALLSADGASYDAGTNQWQALAGWPSGEDHEYGVGVWTGQEFVLWSGNSGGNLTGTGERLAL
ncbi:MAG: hypothetical protein ABJB12_03195 [Pseudomonadota bacterium]